MTDPQHDMAAGYQLARRGVGEVQFLQLVAGAWQETVFAFGTVAAALDHARRERWDAWFLVRGLRTSLRQAVMLRTLAREGGETSLDMLAAAMGGRPAAAMTDAHVLMARGWTEHVPIRGAALAEEVWRLTDAGWAAGEDAEWIFRG